MATILIKKRENSGAPAAGDLTNASGGAEIAVSLSDARLYSKNSAGSIIEIGTKPSSVTTTVVTASAGNFLDFTVSGTTHISEIAEKVNISGTTGASTINLDWNDGGIFYLTGTADQDFSLNIRGASGVSLNSVLATGEAAGFAVMVTQGTSARSQTNLLIDGVTAQPYWQGGVTGQPHANSIDVFAGEVIKTGSAAFTVLESVTQFKK